MTTTAATRPHDRYLAQVLEQFGLNDARAIVLAGSRLEGADYPGSDLDFLAVFDQATDIPPVVANADAVRMATTMGGNWIGWIGSQEINVTVVSADAVRRAAGLLVDALSATRVPMLQPMELVVLHRLRTGTAVLGGDYLAGLVGAEQLARLPLAAFVVYHCSAAAHVRTAGSLLDAGDAFGFEVMMLAAAAALGLATLCAHDKVGTSIRKIATGLAALEAARVDLPLRRADLLALVRDTDARLRLELATSVLYRLGRLAEERGKGDSRWQEACAGLDARI